MKSLILIFTLFTFEFVFSQCEIQGPVVLNKNVTQTYTITGYNIPNCTDCFHWNVAGSNLKAVSTINQKSISIKTTGYGSGNLVASYTVNGIEEKCSIGIDIVEPGSDDYQRPPEQLTQPTTRTENCQIVAGNIEVRTEDEVFQILMAKPFDFNKYNYEWTVGFSDGRTERFNDRIPVVYTPRSISINNISLRIGSSNCLKTINKYFPTENEKATGNLVPPPPPAKVNSEQQTESGN